MLWVYFKNYAYLHTLGKLQVYMLQLTYSTKMTHLQVWQTSEMLHEYIEFYLHDNHKIRHIYEQLAMIVACLHVSGYVPINRFASI